MLIQYVECLLWNCNDSNWTSLHSLLDFIGLDQHRSLGNYFGCHILLLSYSMLRIDLNSALKDNLHTFGPYIFGSSSFIDLSVYIKVDQFLSAIN